MEKIQYQSLEPVEFTDVKTQLRKKLTVYRKKKTGVHRIGTHAIVGDNELTMVLLYVGGLLEEGKFYRPMTGVDSDDFLKFYATLSDTGTDIAKDFNEALSTSSLAGRLGEGTWEEQAYIAVGYTTILEDAIGKYAVKAGFSPSVSSFKEKAQAIADEYKAAPAKAEPVGNADMDVEEGDEDRSTLFVVTDTKEADAIAIKYGLSKTQKKLIGKCLPEGAMPAAAFITKFLTGARGIIGSLTRIDAIVLLRLRKGQIRKLEGNLVKFYPKRDP